MRRRLAFLSRLAVAGLIAAAAAGKASPEPIAIERRLAHPDGAWILVKSIDLRAASIVLSATIGNPGDRAISLNRARSFVLDDGARGVHHLNPPLDDPELRIAGHAEVDAELVFIGPLSPTAKKLTLSTNAGIGTRDNPYDGVPVFAATLPLPAAADATTAGYQANHPDGVTLRVRYLQAGPARCVLALRATNGSGRTIVLNLNHGMAVTDGRGGAVAVTPPADNRELVVPPGDRLDGRLAVDCRSLDTAGPLTLVTNRGTAGTTDNPFDTLPVMALRLAVERPAGATRLPEISQASVAPIARSRLSASPMATAGAPTASPLAAPAPVVHEPSPRRPPPAPTAAAVPPSPPAAPPAGKTVRQLETALHATRGFRGLRVALPADRLFGPARIAALDAAAADPALANLADLIAATHPRVVVVAGHTDPSGNDAADLALSKRRAHAVAAWLEAHLAKRRRPRFVVEGYGRTRPVAPNHNPDGSDNPAGRALNRRVEVSLRR